MSEDKTKQKNHCNSIFQSKQLQFKLN